MIRLGPAPLERGHRREEYHRLRDFPWGISNLNNTLCTLALWSQTEKRSLIWFENRKVVRNLDSASEKHTHACCQQQGGGSRWKLPRALACFIWLPYCTPWSVPSTPSQLCLECHFPLGQRQLLLRRVSSGEDGAGVDLALNLNGVRMAIAGSCWGGIPAAVLPLCIFIYMLGEGDDRGWDCWMASPTPWTWVWASSGSWWWTGRPGMLQSMGW